MSNFYWGDALYKVDGIENFKLEKPTKVKCLDGINIETYEALIWNTNRSVTLYDYHVTEVLNVQMNEIRKKKKFWFFCAGFLQTVKVLNFVELKSDIFFFFKGLTTL